MLTLALTGGRRASMLDDEFERERLEVWFVLTLALMLLRDASTLEDELESERLDV